MTHESVLGTKHDRKKHVELPVIRMKTAKKKLSITFSQAASFSAGH